MRPIATCVAWSLCLSVCVSTFLSSDDIVPISMWHSSGMHSAERLLLVSHFELFLAYSPVTLQSISSFYGVLFSVVKSAEDCSVICLFSSFQDAE